MMNLFKRVLMTLCTIVAVASVNNAVAQAPAGFTTYTVPGGNTTHSSTPQSVSDSQSGLLKRFLMAFDSTAMYTIPQTAPGVWIPSGTCGTDGIPMALHEDQCDFNKTPAMQDCSFFNDIQNFGAMFSWRWRLDTSPQVLELAAYSNYGPGNRQIIVMEKLTAAEVTSISPVEFKIQVSGGTYIFSITGTLANGRVLSSAPITLPRGCSGSTLGGAQFLGYPYFGGTQNAPTTWTSYVEWGQGWSISAASPANGITARYANITAGNSQTTNVSTAFGTALTATVLNSARNPMSGVPVTFRLPASGASGTFAGGLTTATVNSDVNGLVTAPAITANATAGTWAPTAEITTDASPSVQVTSYSLTNQAAGNNSLVVNGGGTQTTNIVTAFATPLSVKITNSGGTGISGVTVNFVVNPVGGAGATLSAASAVTNSSGIAQVTAMVQRAAIPSQPPHKVRRLFPQQSTLTLITSTHLL
jgi:hypothetical protein